MVHHLFRKYVMVLAVVAAFSVGTCLTASEQLPEVQHQEGLLVKFGKDIYAGVSFVFRSAKTVGGTVFGLGCVSATPILLAVEHQCDPAAYVSYPAFSSVWPLSIMILGLRVSDPETLQALHHQIKALRFITIPLSALGAYVLYRTWKEDAPKTCDSCARQAEPSEQVLQDVSFII